ncbi:MULTISPECIES: DUF3618 domain-containing protein [unclassified Mesorhizobium]|uniref:DUF3618 domain-containing protein n=1 Tax=unclassified Mesorhizobium TaxID=325217 RepID=UPI002415A954|nr:MULTISPECIES: DUF3618 domain-containing protein [unclassified Mesorhizobium]WFP65699.1 DUF3618 domain-containing protein [Mesorhizobium sp. WSM4904]WFP78961.1 DUF3618 domain-containing protein [Mesorhizobium sp. WSM4906]
MTERSAAEIEREAEATRARVVATADSIRDKMTPGQLFDEFTGLFRGSAGSDMLHNLKAQVRDNPLPLTVIGAGLAWLMLGSGASATSADTDDATRRGPGPDHRSFGAGIGSTASDAADSVAEAASGAAGTVAGMSTEAAGTMSNVASSAADTLASSAAAAADMATSAGRSAHGMLQDQPLAAAAIGLAIGAAIGAMLPHTEVEDERLGAYRERLRDSAEDTLKEGLDAAKQVAAEAYQTASDEAGRQASSEGTLADKVGGVVKAAADKTDESVREQFSGSDLSSSRKS